MRTTTAIGTHRHLVSVTNPGTPAADGDGGFTQTWTAASPATWHCSIEPATQRDLERVAAGTVIAEASHVLKGRYHSGVTTKSRLTFKARTFNVTGVSNVEERSIDLEVIAVEVVV